MCFATFRTPSGVRLCFAPKSSASLPGASPCEKGQNGVAIRGCTLRCNSTAPNASCAVEGYLMHHKALLIAIDVDVCREEDWLLTACVCSHSGGRSLGESGGTRIDRRLRTLRHCRRHHQKQRRDTRRQHTHPTLCCTATTPQHPGRGGLLIPRRHGSLPHTVDYRRPGVVWENVWDSISICDLLLPPKSVRGSKLARDSFFCLGWAAKNGTGVAQCSVSETSF